MRHILTHVSGPSLTPLVNSSKPERVKPYMNQCLPEGLIPVSSISVSGTRSHPFRTRGISDQRAAACQAFALPGCAHHRACRAGDTPHEPVRTPRAQLGCKQRLACTGAHNVLPRKGGQRVDKRPSLALLLLSDLPMLLIAAFNWPGTQASHSGWLPGCLKG